MYKFPRRPILPELVKVTSDNTDLSQSLYKLDWESKEKQMKLKHDTIVKYSPNPKIKERIFDKTIIFPIEYLDWLYNLKFLIPNNYIKEIAYQAKHGQEEWCRMFPEDYNHLDTAVREHTLNSAIAHFETAFYLLSDCLYDIEKKEHDCGLNDFAKVAMLIYFWDGQTGTGLLLDDNFSGGYNRLSEIYSPNNERFRRPDSIIKLVQDFQKLISENKTRLEQEYIVDSE